MWISRSKMDCSKTCVVIFIALIVSTAGFVLTLTGWFAPPLNDFVHYVRLTGPVILLVGFVIMLISCAMCSFVQGRCCECCYKYSDRKYSLDHAHAHSQLGSAYHRLLLQNVASNHGTSKRHCNGAPPIWEKATPLQHPHAYIQPRGIYPEFKDTSKSLGKEETFSLLPNSCPGSPNKQLKSAGCRSEFSTPKIPPKLKMPPLSPKSGSDSFAKCTNSPPHSPSLSLSSPPPCYEDQESVWIHHSENLQQGRPVCTSTPTGCTRSKEFVV